MPVAVSCTDSISNTYTHLTSMRVRATRNPSEYADGTNVEVFWCASSSGSMSQVLSPPGISCPGDPTGANYIRVDWDEETYNRVVWAVRFRGHDGPPFQIQHYGDNDVSVMESNEIMAPIPLPTWTFARTGGLVLSVMFAEPAADYSEPESGGAGFSPTSPFGGLYGTSCQVLHTQTTILLLQ